MRRCEAYMGYIFSLNYRSNVEEQMWLLYVLSVWLRSLSFVYVLCFVAFPQLDVYLAVKNK